MLNYIRISANVLPCLTLAPVRGVPVLLPVPSASAGLPIPRVGAPLAQRISFPTSPMQIKPSPPHVHAGSGRAHLLCTHPFLALGRAHGHASPIRMLSTATARVSLSSGRLRSHTRTAVTGAVGSVQIRNAQNSCTVTPHHPRVLRCPFHDLARL